MAIDKKIIKELNRYNSINKYITEQEATLPPPPAGDVPVTPEMGPLPAPEMGATPPTPPVTGATPVDIAADPDVEKVGEEKNKVEEIDVTELVKSQKSVEKKQEDYFESLFQHLNTLETKLGEMDSIVNKLNDLESKVEKYRPKSAQEKMDLRTIDSGPFNQKLSDFFQDKQEDFEKTGKNEYILTQDEVENYSPSDIKKSFRSFEDTDNQFTQIK
jgi:hypothetical protein